MTVPPSAPRLPSSPRHSLRAAPLHSVLAHPLGQQRHRPDGTTFEGVARRLPTLRDLTTSDRQQVPPPWNLACAFDVRAQQLPHVDHFPDPSQRETVHARSLLATLPTGSVVIAHMWYFSDAWFDHVIGS